jgi:hypothetical protein
MLQLLKTHRPILLATLLFLGGLLVLAAAYDRIQPEFGEALYTLDDGTTTAFTLPLVLREESATITIELPLDLPEHFPTHYHILHTGIIAAIRVNDKPIDASLVAALPPDDERGITLDFDPLLHPGGNTIEITLAQRDMPPPLHAIDIQASRMDPLLLPLCLLVLLLIGAYGAVLLRTLRFLQKAQWIGVIFLGGTLLRTLYVLATRYPHRAYDWWGHLEYIKEVAGGTLLPAARDGWITYHPPLYYWIGGLGVRLATLVGTGESGVIALLQIASLLFSLLTLAAGIWIGVLLFRGKDAQPKLLLYATLLAVLPSLIYPASQISNDTLFNLLSFLSLGVLITFWKNPRVRTWVLLGFLVTLTALTKGNGLVMAGSAGLVLLLCEKLSLMRKARLLSLLGSILAVGAGWIYVLRLGIEGSSFVGNAYRLHENMLRAPSWEQFLTFNPLRIVLHPYITPTFDFTEPQSLWEHLFGTTLFGWFRFGESLLPFAALTALAATVLLAPLLRGFFANIIHSDDFPLWAVLAVTVLAHIFFFLLFPYASSQHIRYSILLLPIGAAYIAAGTFLLPTRTRDVMLGINVLFILLCTLFIPLIFFST